MRVPPLPSAAIAAVPGQSAGERSWIRAHLLSSPLQVLLTALVLCFLLAIVPALLQWALLQANFSADSGQACRQTTGACWAFIAEKHRLILFGTYPYDEQWRPLAAALLLILLLVASAMPRFWSLALLIVWPVGLATVIVLMAGGMLGLEPVETGRWGGLPLTIMLATSGIGVAFPIGVLLALGRRSDMPAIKALCVIYIELIRGVPLISLLFMSSVMLPLFLPEGVVFDKLLRAQIAIIVFVAAYIAEAVRGGLQGLPKGQSEGADSLGLGYWQKNFKVLLPQALKLVIASLTGIFIGLLKDTSLVVVIGIFDLTSAAKAALSDGAWRGFGVEAYLFIAGVYFVFCYSMSKYGQSVERCTRTDRGS